MARLILEPFLPAHVREMAVSRGTEATFRAFQKIEHLAPWYAKSPSGTLRQADTGEIVLCFGFLSLWPGVAEAWLLISDVLFQHSLEFYRTVKRLIRVNFNILNLHRLQCMVLASSDGNRAFAKALGFTPGAVLAQYGPGREDYVIYEMIREQA